MRAHRLPRVAAAAAIVTAMLLASACSPGADSPRESSSQESSSSGSPSPAPDAAGDAPTCEGIIPESVVSELQEIGWTVDTQEFRIAATIIEGGIQCTWADFTVATDNVQIYGWAPLGEEAAQAAAEDLVSQGWVREENADGVYVTENPDFVISPDDDGYGMTYLFADGQVKVADTRQGLLLVEWSE